MIKHFDITENAHIPVYLMDDNNSVYKSMKMLLANINVHLYFFTSKEELIHAIKKSFPHCLLIEYNLQPDNGLSIYNELKLQEIAPPTIFLSTYSDTSTAVNAMRAGAVDFIEKPFTEARIIKAIKQVIDANQ
jgi:two-component system response regulator FixJ